MALSWFRFAAALLAADTGHSKVVAGAGVSTQGQCDSGTLPFGNDMLFMVEEGETASSRRRTCSESVPRHNAAGTASSATGIAQGQATGIARATGMASEATGMAAQSKPFPAPNEDKSPEIFHGDRVLFAEWAFVAKAYFVSAGFITPIRA